MIRRHLLPYVSGTNLINMAVKVGRSMSEIVSSGSRHRGIRLQLQEILIFS